MKCTSMFYSSGASPIIELTCPEEKSAVCSDVLASLPAWFGIPESSAEYVAGVALLTFFTSLDEQGQAVGFIALSEPSPLTTEIYVMGVKPAYHRQGRGRLLVDIAIRKARERGHRFFMVKTLAASHSSPEYQLTRYFYESLGFTALTVEPELWGPANPCLIMVQVL